MIDWAEEIDIRQTTGSDRRALNGTLRPVDNATCISLIGMPRGVIGENCGSPENPDFLDLLVANDFGPFNATGIRPAVASLQEIVSEVERDFPQIHDRLGTAGMLCCRMVRGSTSVISNHSWGIAIDLKIDGRLDDRGNNRAQRGLLEIWQVFNQHGWYWGAAFPTEDAMHFEASDALIRKWSGDGAFGKAKPVPVSGLSLGARGPAVEALQTALNARLFTQIKVDGLFGKDTRAAVIAFQSLSGLKPTGIATRAVLRALGA